MYDLLIVGAGLCGAAAARLALDDGKTVLIIDRRKHIAGNAFTEEVEGIQVHRYGPHIFHTNEADIWAFVNRFAEFNRFTNSPVANFKGKIYSLPFNMHTFNQMWGAVTPQEAAEIIDEQRKEICGVPRNLEEQAIQLVGRDIYEKLIKGYTEKQWGRSCKDLPASIIRRLPVRLTYNNCYFDDRYQGIPIGGYTRMVERMTEGADIELDVDFLKYKDELNSLAKHVIYTGPIDEYFRFCFGPLEYRSLQFKTDVLDISNFQGNAVVNYTDSDTLWTRIIEHKHFERGMQPKTVITKEYPVPWKPGNEPFYPVNDEKNKALYEKYFELAQNERNVIFAGRLGQYKYIDMDQAIQSGISSIRTSFLNIRHTTAAR